MFSCMKRNRVQYIYVGGASKSPESYTLFAEHSVFAHPHEQTVFISDLREKFVIPSEYIIQ